MVTFYKLKIETRLYYFMVIFCSLYIFFYKVETETRVYYFILALVYRGFVFCVHTPVHLGNEVHIRFHNLSKFSTDYNWRKLAGNKA